MKFSTLQEYGVDKVFFLENDNVDSSQRNVVFLARGENVLHPQAIAGMYVPRYLELHATSSICTLEVICCSCYTAVMMGRFLFLVGYCV